LPYLIDGPTKLTQSNAILRYIARKHNMCEWGAPAPGGGSPGFCMGWLTPLHPAGGETEEEKQRVDMLENHLMDLRMNFARICYNPDFVSTPVGVMGGQIPPRPQGEAEAGVPGAAAQEAAGAVAVPGLPALVCRAEGRWGMLGGFGESQWGLTALPLPQITFVDFLAYDVLDQQRMFVPECPELKGNLAQFLQRFEVSRGMAQPGATSVHLHP
ncbi:Glutathione S-transferase 2, partial [Lamprotornis superbus]